MDGRDQRIALTPQVELDEPEIELASVALVPAFDEWILGYGERGLVASQAAMKLVATVNGIFRPAVLYHGEVIAIWREPSSSRKSADVDYVAESTAALSAAVDSAIAAWCYR